MMLVLLYVFVAVVPAAAAIVLAACVAASRAERISSEFRVPSSEFHRKEAA